MGGRASRNKGANGEREVADILKAALGIDICRTPRSGAWEHAKGDLYGVPGFNVEVKRQERARIDEWYAQAKGDAAEDEIAMLVYRKNRDGWKVVLSLDDFISVMKSHIDINNTPE